MWERSLWASLYVERLGTRPLPLETDYTTDTCAEAHEVQLQIIRSLPPVRHVERTVELSRQLKEMTFAALRRIHPELGEDEIRIFFIERVYGKELADGVREVLARRKGK